MASGGFVYSSCESSPSRIRKFLDTRYDFAHPLNCLTTLSLTLWDTIFAEEMHGPLQLADYVCLAMLLRIRDSLLDADCMSPPEEEASPADILL
jgi:hypothetical protein